LQEQSAELESENYGRQIQIRAHLLNVYIMRDNIRIPLTLLGEMLTNGDERVVLNDEALMKLAQEHPEFFSPKVALRPIIQDFLFPTVAYIGGPSELAYFAQLKKIYEFFDIQMPIIWPRASATLVGGKVKYHIQRLDIKLEDVFRDPDELFKNLVNHTDYQSPEKTFEAAEISLQQLIDWLNDNLSKIDSTLPHQFSVSYKKMQYQLQSMKSKTFNQLKVKYQSMVNSLKKIQIELYPNQKMQERVYNILYFLSLYGFWIMEYMMDNLDIDTDDHQFLEMSSAEE
jgi:bacillithiol biosynthesis cysteine-adding enzyme BshC